MSVRSAHPSSTRSWLSWDTSAPVTPSTRFRQSGTLPYSSTTGDPLPVLYSACPWRITRPAAGSQVSVPPPCPVTGYESAYPRVAVTGVVADRSCRVTAAVVGAGAPRPVPDEAAGENAPPPHASTAPAATAITMPRVAQPPHDRWRRLVCCAATSFLSPWAVSPPRGSVPLPSRRLRLVLSSLSRLTRCRCRAVLRG